MHDAHDAQKNANEQSQHQKIHAQVVVQRNKAQQIATRNALQTVLSTGKWHLQADEVNHLRHCQGHHRKVNALAANRHQPDQQAEHACCQRARQNAQFGRPACTAHQPTGDVRSGPHECRMPKRQQTGKSQQQIEGACEDREAQGVHQKHRVQTGKRRNDQQHQNGQPDGFALACHGHQRCVGRRNCGAQFIFPCRTILPAEPLKQSP